MVLHIGGDAYVRIGDIIAVTVQKGSKETEVIAWERGKIRRYTSDLSPRTLGRRAQAPYGDAFHWTKHAR